MQLVRVLSAVLFSAALFACGSSDTPKKTGRTTLPSAATISSAAKKPASHASLGTSTDQAVTGACGTANNNLCGCLPSSEWYSDGTLVYDVVCCNGTGDSIMLHSCGDKTCDDSGTDVMCM